MPALLAEAALRAEGAPQKECATKEQVAPQEECAPQEEGAPQALVPGQPALTLCHGKHCAPWSTWFCYWLSCGPHTKTLSILHNGHGSVNMTFFCARSAADEGNCYRYSWDFFRWVVQGSRRSFHRASSLARALFWAAPCTFGADRQRSDSPLIWILQSSGYCKS